MLNYKNQKGFTLIETIVAVSIMVILIALAGGISSKFALRRNVEGTINKIISELNLIKLQAARDGVQYRTTIDFTDTGSERYVTIETKRGDSNRTSSFAVLAPIASEDYKIMDDYIFDQAQYILDFNPNGTAVQGQIIVLRPEDDQARVSKCAIIQVTQFGIIRSTIGSWDFTGDDCNPISDMQEAL